jgi:predicted RNase H-like HicB family nuclease
MLQQFVLTGIVLFAISLWPLLRRRLYQSSFSPAERRSRMYRVWYWAMIDREDDGRFIASIPDLGDLAAYGRSDKDAVAHVTRLASQHVRAAVDDGQPVPPRRQFSEMPSHVRSKEVGRAMSPVEVERREAWPNPPYLMSA